MKEKTKREQSWFEKLFNTNTPSQDNTPSHLEKESVSTADTRPSQTNAISLEEKFSENRKHGYEGSF